MAEKNNVQNLIEVLDKEYKAYLELKDLFSEKRELLKKAKSDDLGVLDNKIIAINNKIKGLNNLRKDLSIEITGKDSNMSEFIAFAQENFPDYTKE